MKRITKEQYAQAYVLARAVAAGTIKAPEARKQLAMSGMNTASAHFYLGTMVHIIRGERFGRTIGDPAVAYVLGEIRDHEEVAALKLALQSLRSHIEYYGRYAPRPGLRSIVASFE